MNHGLIDITFARYPSHVRKAIGHLHLRQAGNRHSPKLDAPTARRFPQLPDVTRMSTIPIECMVSGFKKLSISYVARLIFISAFGPRNIWHSCPRRDKMTYDITPASLA